MFEDTVGHQQAEDRYRELADSITDVFFAMDQDLRYTYWNKASERLTGIRAEEALGRSLLDVFPDTPWVRSAERIYRDVLRTQQPQMFVTEPDLGGKRYVFEISVYPSSSGISVFVKDITKRRWVEAALRESEEQFRTLAESSPLGIVVSSPDGQAIYVNPALLGISGLTYTEFVGQGWLQAIPPQDRERFIETLGMMMSQRKAVVFEHRVQHASGQILWVVAHAAPVFDSDGEVVRLVGTVMDITQRKQAEEEANRRAEELSVLNRSVHQLTQSLDLSTVAETIAHICVQTFDVSLAWLLRAETDGSTSTLAHFPSSISFPAQVTIRWSALPLGPDSADCAIRSGRRVSFPNLAAAPDYVLWREAALEAGLVTSTAFPLVNGERTFGCLNLYSDRPGFFTPQRTEFLEIFAHQAAIALENARLFEQVHAGGARMEHLSRRLLDAQETERRYIARELHDEIGQALTVLKVNLQAARRVAGDPALVPYLDDSIHTVQGALQQVRSLSLDLRPSLLDDLGLVPALRWYIDRQAQQAGFTARFASDPLEERLSPEVEIACFRIVQEALTNVLRHAEASEVSVELRCGEEELHLTIRDDGLGFDVPAARRDAAYGLSMGLLSMEERAQLLGGRIEIESGPGQGAELRAYLPAAGGAATNQHEETEP